MSDAKGFKVIVKINLPPDKQYQQGHSLIIQGDTVAAVEKLLDEAVGSGDSGHGKVILALFTEQALGHGAQAVLNREMAKGSPPPAPVADAPAPADISPSSPASKGQLDVIAKKFGRPLTDEEKAMTKEQAKAIISGEEKVDGKDA